MSTLDSPPAMVAFLAEWGAELLSLGALTVSFMTIGMTRKTSTRTYVLECVAKRREIVERFSEIIEATRAQQDQNQKIIELIHSPPDWVLPETLKKLQDFLPSTLEGLESDENFISRIKTYRTKLISTNINMELSRKQALNVLDILNEQETQVAGLAADQEDTARALSQKTEVIESLKRIANRSG